MGVGVQAQRAGRGRKGADGFVEGELSMVEREEVAVVQVHGDETHI